MNLIQYAENEHVNKKSLQSQIFEEVLRVFLRYSETSDCRLEIIVKCFL